MKRIILTHGAIAGFVVIASMLLGFLLADEDTTMSAHQWLGYLVMIVALSLIFVGIKKVRDRELGGVIRFGTATKVGLGITLIASLVYVVVWEINLSLTDYAFIDHYTESILESKRQEGLSGEALAAAESEMEALKTTYANPLFRLPMTFLEIFPVGLLITLISAAILRNRKVLPATA